QAARGSDFRDGAAAAPSRSDRLAGIEDHREILDLRIGPGIVCLDDAEIEMKKQDLAAPVIRFNATRALVVGMAKSGVASVALLVKQGAEVRTTDSRVLSELQEVERTLVSLHEFVDRRSP